METVANKKGQALLELILSFPIFLMLLGILYRSNLAAQVAINNAQFARTQIYVLAHNSPEYPRIQHRSNITGSASVSNFVNAGHNRMVLSVVDPTGVTANTEENDDPIKMVPTVQFIGRDGTTAMGSDEPGEVKTRTKVRVRNSAVICTQSNFIPGKSGKNTYLNTDAFETLGKARWPFGVNVCAYAGEEVQ